MLKDLCMKKWGMKSMLRFFYSCVKIYTCPRHTTTSIGYLKFKYDLIHLTIFKIKIKCQIIKKKTKKEKLNLALYICTIYISLLSINRSPDTSSKQYKLKFRYLTKRMLQTNILMLCLFVSNASENCSR